MVVWKLHSFINERKLTPRQVEEAAGIGRNTIYRVLRDDGALLVDRRTLTAIIDGLRKITGEEVKVEDLLAYDEGAEMVGFKREYSTPRTKVTVNK